MKTLTAEEKETLREKFEKQGITKFEVGMGSGGKHQTRIFPQLGVARFQLKYGHGKYNYTDVKELNIAELTEKEIDAIKSDYALLK
jgi:hypothetical protein